MVNTDSYKYLGIIFNYNGKYWVAKQDLLLRGKRAMFALITKAGKLHLPIDVQLELFDAVVTPVVLYGSEIWCHEGCEIFILQFCKIILCLKMNVQCSRETKISWMLYKLLYKMHLSNFYHNEWLMYIKKNFVWMWFPSILGSTKHTREFKLL